MSLREKIASLWPYDARRVMNRDVTERTAQYLDRDEVLRIVAEHEQPIPDLTPGGAVILKPQPANEVKAAGGRGGGVEFRTGLPAEALRMVWPTWVQQDQETKAETTLMFKGDVYRFVWWADWMPDRLISSCDAWGREHFRPCGKTWAEVEQMAGMQPWRALLKMQHWRVMGGYKLPKAEQNELTELEALAALASVIESGKGEAVVPEGVAKFLTIDGSTLHGSAGTYRRGSHGGYWNLVEQSEHYASESESSDRLLAAIDAFGNSLVGAK